MSHSTSSMFHTDAMPDFKTQHPVFPAMAGSASAIFPSLFSKMRMQTDIKDGGLLLLTLEEMGCDIHEASTREFIIAKQDGEEYAAFKSRVKDGFFHVWDSGEYIAFKRDAKLGSFSVFTAAGEWTLPVLLDGWMKRLIDRYHMSMRTALKQVLEQRMA